MGIEFQFARQKEVLEIGGILWMYYTKYYCNIYTTIIKIKKTKGLLYSKQIPWTKETGGLQNVRS